MHVEKDIVWARLLQNITVPIFDELSSPVIVGTDLYIAAKVRRVLQAEIVDMFAQMEKPRKMLKSPMY